MIVIGSQAMKRHGLLAPGIEPKDTDIIGTFHDFQQLCVLIRRSEGIERCVPLSGHKYHIRSTTGWNYEFEIAWPKSSGEDLLDYHKKHYGEEKYAQPEELLALKLSHRYLRNSPHFLKTMRDVHGLRKNGVQLNSELEQWLPVREKETYTYSHPKLDVSKMEFFEDSVNYIYDHDSIHAAVAIRPSPAYTHYMRDGSEVMTSKEKFMSVSEEIRLLGVYEESCVLALERSQIPNNFTGPSPKWSFQYALQKVCTSITSGWFREWAWEHYEDVLSLYETLGEADYIDRFVRNSHMLKPFTENSANKA